MNTSTVFQLLLATCAVGATATNSLLAPLTPAAATKSTKYKFIHGKMFVIRPNDSLPTSKGSRIVNGVEEKWFSQVLDHFNPKDGRRWQQRYFVNRQFYRPPSGPVFLVVDGEWTAFPEEIMQGGRSNLPALARDMGALLLQLEHRFYGKSQPTANASNENLKYLSSRQALKDLETFTIAMKNTHNLQHNRWVAFGASYAGTLTAWYRLKSPAFVHAALASSAPLDMVADFKAYLRVVIASLITKHSQACADEIKEAVDEARSLIEKGKWKQLTRVLNLCGNPLRFSRQDVAFIFEALADNIAFAVQYNQDPGPPCVPPPTNGSKPNIADVCSIMTNTSNDIALQRYAKVHRFIAAPMNSSSKSGGAIAADCDHDLDYSHFINSMMKTTWSSEFVLSGARQWMWQTCTEFGNLQTSYAEPGDIFGLFPVDFFLQECADIFGPKFTKEFVLDAINVTQAFYGGRDAFRRVTNVIFTNGGIDPWHVLGITQQSQTNQGNVVLFMPEASHINDYLAQSPLDSPSLLYARSVTKATLEDRLGLKQTASARAPTTLNASKRVRP